MLTPLVLLIPYPEESHLATGFLVPGLALVVSAVVVWQRYRPRHQVSLTYQEGTIIVVLTWGLAVLVGAVPFLMVSHLNFTQAVLESTSGWTTAGLSVVDVEQAPRLILLYRSVTQLAGGAGLAIIMLSALAGPVGVGLASAEGRGEQLLPHVKRSAMLVLSMYTGYVLVGTVGLRVAGMDWFDAVNHAFAALSTGGFSTHAASIGHWDSPAIEAVTVVLMLLGMLNFATAYMLLRGNLQSGLRSSEVRQAGLLLALGTVVLLFGGIPGLYGSLGQRARVAIFHSVSALSTTGFATVTFEGWSGLGWLLLIVFMLLGGSTGSTAGGIKQERAYVLLRGLLWEFRRRLLPRNVVSEPDVWRGEERHFLTDRHLRRVAMFVFLYLAFFVVGSAIMTAYGYPLQDSLFEFASTLSTVGLSVGVTTPDAPAGILWLQTFAMILGRLEFFTVVIGVVRIARDLPAMWSR
jgi:trk system potassium uptake protein TrkH